MKKFNEKIEEYYDEMDEDECAFKKQKEAAPSYDPDAWAEEFNYMERMC